MRKEVLEKRLTRLEGRKAALTSKALESNSAEEVRAINATLAELNAHKWVSYNAVAKAALTLPPERRKGLTDALKKLAAAGREVLWNETKRTFERRDAAEE